MSQGQVRSIKDIFSRLSSPSGRVARFSYEEDALINEVIEGVENFNIDEAQNIPLQTKTDTDNLVLSKGVRAQGASISRNFQNHFMGRLSYNMNMVVIKMLSFLGIMERHLAQSDNLYDPSAEYRTGDVCYIIESGAVPVQLHYQRIGASTTLGEEPSPSSAYWRQVKAQGLVYSASMQYKTGDICCRSEQVGNAWVNTVYRRVSVSPEVIVNIGPPNEAHWVRVVDSGTQATELTGSEHLDSFRKVGTYTAYSSGVYGSVQGLPAAHFYLNVAEPFTLRVYGSPADDRLTVQEIMFMNTGMQYTRVFSDGTITNNWYKTKDPVGLNIEGVPHLWAFRIEDVIDENGVKNYGRLLLYHRDSETEYIPNIRIDLVKESDTYGHLIWHFTEDEEGV